MPSLTRTYHTFSATTIMRMSNSLFLLCLSLLVLSAQAAIIHPLIVQSGGAWSVTEDGVRVPVVLGVMSGCPDALLCESVFDRVIQRVADKVDLSLSFIGT